jgi:hypothetical protein
MNEFTEPEVQKWVHCFLPSSGSEMPSAPKFWQGNHSATQFPIWPIWASNLRILCWQAIKPLKHLWLVHMASSLYCHWHNCDQQRPGNQRKSRPLLFPRDRCGRDMYICDPGASGTSYISRFHLKGLDYPVSEWAACYPTTEIPARASQMESWLNRLARVKESTGTRGDFMAPVDGCHCITH